MSSLPKVLVVDDSAFARKVLREVLARSGRFEVVGFARDGLDALEKIAELRPDVITLDLMMPELDGVGVLKALAERPDAPRVVIVTMTDAEGALGVAALDAGAFDVVQKPTAIATDRLYTIENELVEKVALAASSRSVPATKVAAPSEAPRIAEQTELVVIGASTGGPRALALLLDALPASFPVPIAAVVHMPIGYTEAFASRLDASSPLRVREAVDGHPLRAGEVVIARAGIHLAVARTRGRLEVALDPRIGGALHIPAVDVLFTTAASASTKVLGVVLTGMGTDGLAGARAIVAAHGRLLVEDASSCVVYGMPRAIAEAKLGAIEVPLGNMARAILSNL